MKSFNLLMTVCLIEVAYGEFGKKTESINKNSLVMKMKIYILFFLFFLSCTHRQPMCSLITPEIYERDKHQVADCIMRNIEYIRVNYNIDSIRNMDVAYYYKPFAGVYYHKCKKFLQAPIPANEYLNVITDTIIYNENGLKCFIFVCIEEKTIESKEFKTVDKGRNYAAKAFVGVRENLYDSQIYGYDSYKSAVKDLKHLFYNHLKDDYISASVYMDNNRIFDRNVGEPGFFESVIFQRYTDSTYYYQYDGYELMQYHYMK